MTAEVLVVTGTDTGVGKTIVTAAIAAIARTAGRRVAVMKAAQTGVSAAAEADIDVFTRLAQPSCVAEGARYREALAPTAAIRVGGEVSVPMRRVIATVDGWRSEYDLVLVEGAGGLLVGLDEKRSTIADIADALDAPVVLVTRANLGTLNHTGLTLEAMTNRGLRNAGVIIGAWPGTVEIDCRSNLVDLPGVIGAELEGILPANAGQLTSDEFAILARAGLAPRFGGDFDAADFRRRFLPRAAGTTQYATSARDRVGTSTSIGERT